MGERFGFQVGIIIGSPQNRIMRCDLSSEYFGRKIEHKSKLLQRGKPRNCVAGILCGI